MAEQYIIGTKSEFSQVADALRELKGTTDTYSLPELANEIKTIASTTLEEQEIYPGSSDIVLPEGALLTGDVTIKGDENLVHTNIANGVEIYGVTGTRPDKFDGLTISVVANVDSGTITATQGDTTVSGELQDGGVFLTVPAGGEWTLGGTSGERVADTGTASLTGVDNVKIVFFEATVGCYIMGDVSATVTCTNGTKTYTSTGTGKQYFAVYEKGNWTVACNINGSETKLFFNVQQHKGLYIDVVNGDPDALANCSWEVIQAVANAGKGADYWALGDAKQIVLNGKAGITTYDNVSIWTQIIGFNHNPDYEGGNSIHFQIGTTAQTGGTQVALVNSNYGYSSSSASCFNMNYSSTNTGGWAASKMRTVMLPSLKAIMPTDLTSVIKVIPKYTDNVGGGSGYVESNVSATEDDLFLLSYYEVFGGTSTSYANKYENGPTKQYAYYSAGNSKIRYKHSSTETACYYWLRSPYYNRNYYFCCVLSDGNADYYSANLSYGCAPGFAV